MILWVVKEIILQKHYSTRQRVESIEAESIRCAYM